MNHRPTLPSPIERRTCSLCAAEFSMVFLRRVSADGKYLCRNQAACRKRQRQRQQEQQTSPTPET